VIVGLVVDDPELAVGEQLVAEDGVGAPEGGRCVVVEAERVGDGPVEAGGGAVVVLGCVALGAGLATAAAVGVVGGGGEGRGLGRREVLALERGAVPDEPDDDEDEEEAEDVAEDDGDEPEAVLGPGLAHY